MHLMFTAKLGQLILLKIGSYFGEKVPVACHKNDSNAFVSHNMPIIGPDTDPPPGSLI